jgi:NAD(P)-dependent dehydrogenase (short-subunit alcohol dehydrogenase family)
VIRARGDEDDGNLAPAKLQFPLKLRFKQDVAAQKALSETVKLADMKSEDFDTIFYVGGHGPMWDLAESPVSIALLESFYNSGKPIALVSTNLLGFFYITQRTVTEMLKQRSGCVVSITAALADRPIAGVNGSVSMITKGGLDSATQNLAIEYAKNGIRFNAVAPGVVDTPMHPDDPNDSTSQPAMKKATVKDIVDAVLYLAQAGHVSGEILHVDGAAPARRW